MKVRRSLLSLGGAGWGEGEQVSWTGVLSPQGVHADSGNPKKNPVQWREEVKSQERTCTESRQYSRGRKGAFNLLAQADGQRRRASLRHGVVGAVISFWLVFSAGEASASLLSYEKGLGWASQRDLTSQQFSTAFEDYRKRGYIMIDVDAYPVGNDVRYSMIWQENRDKRGWAEHRDMTSDGYKEKWDEYHAKGYRPLDVEAYTVGGQVRWAGIWVENTEGLRWASFRGDSASDYGERFKTLSASGFRVVDLEIYPTPQALRYASIWIENKDKRGWIQLRDMSRQTYQSEVEAKSGQGWRVIDFESYQTPQGQRYAAIWEKVPGLAWQTRTDRTEGEFANLWRQHRDEGYRLVDFERYDTPNGPRYGGVWAENDSRFKYARKGQIDTAIQNYRNTNALPGISVSVIRNGEMIYRRGFGFADVADNKVAHGDTIYNAASVSKVIGGTLAAKLEEEGRLRDGSTFRLDLRQLTSTYLENLPNANGSGTVSLPAAHRAHTVEQLLSHLSCVAHYNTTPSIANQTAHYANAIAAVQSLWRTGLVTRMSRGGACTVGSTRSYSTPAFTFVAAVLERATGRNIARLVDEEIADQYGLSSMRVMYSSPSLPENYDRATPYASRDRIHTAGTTDFADPPNNRTNPNVETSYSNSSWKVLGGGVEVSPVDLARFGWRLLNGDIVDANIRDNRLWTQVAVASANGLAWDLRTIGGRRVAQHSGSWVGARSFLLVYRDDGLVIAIMSNRRDHRSDLNQDAANLAAAIGNIVLN